MKKSGYISGEILKALAVKHSKDVFIPECKDGPTQSVSRYLRMDAWVMNKSWANPAATGYEIKVSRSDFLSDNKWPGYLPLCNQFYFVAPRGLIDVSELPAEVGLMTIAGKGDGARLLTKKKAPHREIEIPESLYRYILMCRVVVGAPEAMVRETEADHWRRWLQTKRENQKLGYGVARRIREVATELELENYRLKSENEKYAGLQQMLEAMGIGIHNWNLQQSVQDRLSAHRSVFNEHLITAMRDARNKIDTALKIAANIDAGDEQVAVNQ